MRATIFTIGLGLGMAQAACFSEADGNGDDGSCPVATLGCPCDGDQCGATLECDPSIGRCVQVGGSTDGQTVTSSPTTSATSAESTSTSDASAGDTTLLTGADTTGVSASVDTGAVDTGGACLAPTCSGCDDCSGCLACASGPVGACEGSCETNAECADLRQCAMSLPMGASFAETCCGMPCDKVCIALFGAWRDCATTSCVCDEQFAC